MPTVLDSTVVNRADDTSGNGGRKLVKLKNGNQYAITRSSTTLYLQKTTNNWSTKTEYTSGAMTAVTDAVLATDGVRVYLLTNVTSSTMRFYTIDDSAPALSSNFTTPDTASTAIGKMSAIVNDAGTEIHAVWDSTHASYPNSRNIRYAKGTINADGSVTWGAVVQVTTTNTASNDNTSPSIVLKSNGLPTILFSHAQGTTNHFIFSNSYNGTSFETANASRGTVVYNPNANYAQSSPSAIFVPQSVNGLANGRIWVAWEGKDATDTTRPNIRVSYSDDGGVTWSAMVKITSGNIGYNMLPTITANKSGKVFLVWYGSDSSSQNVDYRVRQVTNDGSGWSSITNLTTTGSQMPSTLFDLTLNFTSPLFIYMRNNATINFYGTWLILTISVTQGALGTKTDKANLLQYAITTDGAMSTITEKVNGVTIGTKTATSGQSLIAGLTQAQWDAVRFGKYKDVTGGANTLTVEMGSETFTYTFDKRLATDADVLSAVKAIQDADSVATPAKKALLASAIRAKGGSVSDGDAFEVMASVVGGIPLGKKFASGTTTSTGTSYYDLAVSGLSFTPSTVVVVRPYSASYMYIFAHPKITELQNSFIQGASGGTLSTYGYTSIYKLTNGGFTLRFITNTSTTDTIYWYAIE